MTKSFLILKNTNDEYKVLEDDFIKVYIDINQIESFERYDNTITLYMKSGSKHVLIVDKPQELIEEIIHLLSNDIEDTVKITLNYPEIMLLNM
jgi:hypothetical protein